MSKTSLRASSIHSFHRINMPLFKKKSNQFLDTFRGKWPKKDTKLKPFGYCCSLDHFDPLSRYDQRMPPYKSSLMAITSVHECPVAKMQTKFSTRLPREKKKPAKMKAPDIKNEQKQLKNNDLSYYQISKNNRYIKRSLEDEIASAKDIFWTEKQKAYNETSKKIIRTGQDKYKRFLLRLKTAPRWYQDLSPNQMKNLMQLENVIRIDYEETKTSGTQTTLNAIGVTSTFFILKPSIIRELHKSCNLNSVDFLRKIYQILTGNDFCEEGYKKTYNCNEKIILSAIAFLTLPETVKELHKRLPAVVMPKFPPKPKLMRVTRRKDPCPYKEELFTAPNWIDYRKALQKWRKQCKLIAVPKIFLSLNEIVNNKEIKEQTKDIFSYHLKKISTKELQKDFPIMYDQDFVKKKTLDSNISATSTSQSSDKKSSSLFNNLIENEVVEYKICGPPKPPEMSQKSWLREKDAHYVIAGVSAKDLQDKSVTYEIAGVANVTPSNSDEKFFEMLKFDDQSKKIFPSGRENLSRNWQEWLQNVDEDYEQLKEQADELVKSMKTTLKSASPRPIYDSCCSCRQMKKFETMQQDNKTLTNTVQNEEKNMYIMDSTTIQSSELNSTGLLINQAVSKNEIKTSAIISGITKEAGQTHYYISGFQEDKIPRTPEILILQPVKNVPPCSCAIQQMIDKDINFADYENIPWKKEEEFCPGKKYRPNEPGAYSCKSYPGDKCCRHNPFIKELMKIQKQKTKEQQEEKEDMKEKMEFIESTKKETDQVLEKDFVEKKKDKFISNPGCPTYDDPWNISRTAPTPKILKTDYETALKLTSPFTNLSSSKTQQEQNDILFSTKFKKIKNNPLNKKNNKETFNISLKPSEKIKKEKEEIENMQKKNKESNKKIKKAINKEKEEIENVQKKNKESTLSNKKIKKAINKEKEEIENVQKKNKESTLSNKKIKKSINKEKEEIENMQKKNKESTFSNVKIKKAINKEKEEIENMQKKNKESTFLKSTTINKKETKLSHINSKSTTIFKTGKKQQKNNLLSNNPLSNNPINKSEDIKSSNINSRSTTILKTGKKYQRNNLSSNDLTRKSNEKTKSLNINSRSTTKFKGKEHQTDHLPSNNPTRKSNKINKLTKHNPKKENIIDETEEIYNRKQEMAKLKNMFKFSAGSYMQPIILPGELSTIKRSNPKEKIKEIVASSIADNKEETRRIQEEPCGWRTKSEQELSAKKTLVYLCEPDYPLETMAIGQGGRPCRCRENRNKKKILMYNISGLVEKKRNGMRARRIKLEEENRIIEGVFYTTPPVSPRRSDEYIPEYDLLESPYDMCVSKTTDKITELIEKYCGPKSLVEKIRKKPRLCNCSKFIRKDITEEQRNIQEARKKLMESKSPEERWKIALKDAALMDYFTQRKDNVPCWISCKKITYDARPRRLKVINPVCECKYERKIVERNEEKINWRTRQQKLKDLKKKSFTHIVDISRPMVEEKKFIISDVKRTLQKDEEDDIKYCISGVAEDTFMLPPQKIIDGIKMSTPFQTPVPSKEDILQTITPHRHWSPIKIPPGPLPRKDDALKEEIARRKRIRDETYKLIYNDKNKQDASCLTTRNDREVKKEEKIEHKNDRLKGGGSKRYINNKSDLVTILKDELKKMAAEGYIFAKLPECYLMPQLQDWIMYRKGIVIPETNKKNLMQATIITWQLIDVEKIKIKKPSLDMTKRQLDKLTFDQVNKMKRKIEKVTKAFHSEVRKERVSYAHTMWHSMKCGKFPAKSFKRTFFTYMPGKEADGHMYRPWYPCEIRERDPKFCCC